MSKNIVRTLILMLVASVIGMILYAKYGDKLYTITGHDDSLLVKNVHAMSNETGNNSQISESRQTAITRAIKRVSPSVVSVTVLQVREYRVRSPFSARDPLLREWFPELFKDRRYQEEIQELGSGTIISSDGYILTNDHVVENATKIIITMAGGTETEATLIGHDPRSDVALLKIDKDNLPFALFGNSENIILGEWAIAIGNPFGLFEKGNRSTVTVGVISALNRDFGEMENRVYQDMIQTDASINHGNSGGPLCNAAGEVIGMNTFIYTGSRHESGSVGIGFAIPINRIANLLDDLKEYHEIDRDFWIGMRVQNLNSISASKMGFKGTDGVMVTSIEKRSPAAGSGIKLGDIITQINDTIIRNDKDVIDIVYYDINLRVGDKLNLKIWRDGQELDINLVLESTRKQ